MTLIVCDERVVLTHLSIALGPCARAAEDRVGAVGPLLGGRQPEQVGAAADHVILTEAAMHQVVATVAFQVIVAVARPFHDLEAVDVAADRHLN